MKLLYSLALIAAGAVLLQGHQVESDTILDKLELNDHSTDLPDTEDRSLRGRNLDEDDNSPTDLLEFHYCGSTPQIVKDVLANVSKELNSLIISRPYYNLRHELVIEDVCKLPLSENVVLKPQILQSIPVYVGPGSRDADIDVQAYAGSCRDYIHRVYKRTLVGRIRFHPAVINDTSTNVQHIHDLLLHEAIHILGFGVFWSNHIIYGNSNTPWYSGSANIEFRKLLPEGDHRKKHGGIPIEDVGDFGRFERHWRTSIFPDELMSGAVVEGEKQILSILTAAAIQDLGFTVNYSSPLIQPYDIPYFEDPRLT